MQMSQLKPSQYEPLLKEQLECWKCNREFKTMPLLKAHLQEEWEAEAKREKAKLERKRKRTPDEPEGREGNADNEEDEPNHKRQAQSHSGSPVASS